MQTSLRLDHFNRGSRTRRRFGYTQVGAVLSVKVFSKFLSACFKVLTIAVYAIGVRTLKVVGREISSNKLCFIVFIIRGCWYLFLKLEKPPFLIYLKPNFAL